jgi:tRNA1Val (adenine37-N6)-methyltransferase
LKKRKEFRFKKFSVHDERCSMKVGTDAVLLGAWVDVSGAQKILDVGTGSGVIALMLAQRSSDDAHIDAIEIGSQDADQAKENVAHSPWPEKISVFHKALQEFEPGCSYDLIVSNPPFFNKSLLPPSERRARTRHTMSLSTEELLDHSLKMLNPTGKLALVLPYLEGNDLISLASMRGWHLIRQLAFFTRREKPQERWLFELGLVETTRVAEKLVLYDEAPSKSKFYIRLTRDFYL